MAIAAMAEGERVNLPARCEDQILRLAGFQAHLGAEP